MTFIFETWCKGELLAWNEGCWKPVNGLFLRCIYRRKYLFEVLLLFETRYGRREKYKELNRSWCKFRMTAGVKDWNGLPSWINSDAQIIRISKCLRQFWMFSFCLRGVTTLTKAVWAVLWITLCPPGNFVDPPEFFGGIPHKCLTSQNCFNN